MATASEVLLAFRAASTSMAVVPFDRQATDKMLARRDAAYLTFMQSIGDAVNGVSAEEVGDYMIAKMADRKILKTVAVNLAPIGDVIKHGISDQNIGDYQTEGSFFGCGTKAGIPGISVQKFRQDLDELMVAKNKQLQTSGYHAQVAVITSAKDTDHGKCVVPENSVYLLVSIEQEKLAEMIRYKNAYNEHHVDLGVMREVTAKFVKTAGNTAVNGNGAPVGVAKIA